MEFDCQTCGACCAQFDVMLSGAEQQHFEDNAALVELTVLYERPGWQIRLMKRDEVTGRCVALKGPFEKCGCSIYEDRPNLCREFAPGSPDCITARRKHGRG